MTELWTICKALEELRIAWSDHSLTLEQYHMALRFTREAEHTITDMYTQGNELSRSVFIWYIMRRVYVIISREEIFIREFKSNGIIFTSRYKFTEYLDAKNCLYRRIDEYKII